MKKIAYMMNFMKSGVIYKDHSQVREKDGHVNYALFFIILPYLSQNM